MAASLKALVVDDSGSTRTLVARILSNLGADQIAEAENGLDAIRVIESGYLPDLALVDWYMPAMDGYEFVCAVRRRPEWRSMTIMMMTAENEHSRVVQALAAGAAEYLIKSFTADALIDKLSLLGLNPAAEQPGAVAPVPA